jgi:general secretion pathway protein M
MIAWALPKTLVNHWQQWNQRERLLVTIASVVLLLYLFYLFIVSPLQEAILQAQTLAQENQATLVWMKRIKSQVHSLAMPKVISTSELMGIIHDQLAETAGLSRYPYHLTQSSSGNIEIKFDKVPFNKFLSWCYRLNQKYHFNIKQLSANQTETAGITQLTCVLTVS